MSEVVRWNAEDASVYMALATGDYVLYVDHERAIAEARAAALRDAVEAVKALTSATHPNDEPPLVYAHDAIAAIEALGKQYDGQWERDLYGGTHDGT